MKRFLSLLLVFCMVIVLGACGQGNTPAPASTPVSTATAVQASTAPASTATAEGGPITNEKVTLKVVVYDDAGVSYDDNGVVKWLEEKTNVHIDWNIIQDDGEGKNLDLIVASGDLPDIMDVYMSAAKQQKYASEGVIIPLDDMLGKFGTYTQKLIDYLPDTKKIITAPDGKIYGLPMLEECYHCSWSAKAWINKTWLDNLGLQMPVTTDDFYNVLKAFKTGDPNGNGKADEVPLALGDWEGNIDGFIMDAFVYSSYGQNRLTLNSGVVAPAYTQDAYREGLKYLNKLYKEGLIYKDSVSGKELEAYPTMTLVENTDAIQLGVALNGGPAGDAENEAAGAPTSNYVTVPPLTGPAGFSSASYYPPFIWGGKFISKSCKNPEVAFKWLDFLVSDEASLWQIFGVEGKDWQRAAAGTIGLDGKPAIIDTSILPAGTESGNLTSLGYMWPKALFNGQVASPDRPNWIEVRLAQETMKNYDGKQPKEILPTLVPDQTITAEYDELQSAISSYVTESVLAFVRGDMDVNNDWDSYITKLKGKGLDRYIQLTQETYDRMYK